MIVLSNCLPFEDCFRRLFLLIVGLCKKLVILRTQAILIRPPLPGLFPLKFQHEKPTRFVTFA